MKGEWIRRGYSDIVVIFIHGILSDGDTAWRSGKGTYWPQLLAEEPEFEGAGIYVYSYHTKITSKDYSISDAADGLHELLTADKILDRTKLIFCCHSMGGIVARKYLLKHQLELSAGGRQIGMFLVGSPSLGSKLADVANILTKNIVTHIQLEDLRSIDSNRWLYELNSDFKRLRDSANFHIMGKELIEDSSDAIGRTIGPIVLPHSAAAFFKDELRIPKSSHSSICKPTSKDDMQHRALCNFLASMLEWRLAPKPKKHARAIEFTSNTVPQHFKFDYKYRFTDFVGRTKELEELKQFVYSDAPFSWWVLKGPGGSGKSRLASELILDIANDSKTMCLFVQQSDLNQYSIGTRELSEDTVLVVDYAARFFTQILEIIHDYSTKLKQNFKLRILLIERETDGHWWTRFSQSYEAARTQHAAEPLEIAGVNEEQIIHIIKDVISKENKELPYNDVTIFQMIKRLDPQLRPLFGMFLGVSLADKVFENHWNQYDLLAHQLRREALLIERKYAELGNELILRHRRLLTLATICNGIEEEKLKDVLNRGIYWLPTLSEFNKELYDDMSGFREVIPDLGVAPLLPDILGEFFVLESLNVLPTTPYKDAEFSEQLMSLAIEISFIKYFLRRVLQDFPTHKNVPLLFGAKFQFGMIGADLLILMSHIFSGNQESLIALWKCAKYLHDNQDGTEKLFMDHPTRVYQEATTIMVCKYVNSLNDQLLYYDIVKSNLDTLIKAGRELLSRENGMIDMFVPDMAYQESVSISAIIETFRLQKKIKQSDVYVKRLDYLNTTFNDPRLRYLNFISYKVFYFDKPEVVDEKIRQLTYFMFNTPPQLPPIDVNHEKSLFMNGIFFYYLKERNDEATARKYYQEFSKNLFQPNAHRFSVAAIEQYAHTAANAIEFLLSLDNRSSCIWYFNNIKYIYNFLGPNSSGIIIDMIREFENKLSSGK
ncbi:esterase/lipase family protein [Dyadobacter sp.]|uniref:esterase/lipase family protein n=1 Tax=Dyadobacter sp. TaxID=1914288 RepID=UPI003F71FF40